MGWDPGRVRGIVFSIIGLSFLTVWGDCSPALADPVDDALRCLDDQGKTAARRDLLIGRADSLGRIAEAAQKSGQKTPEALLRKAEKIQREAMDEQLGWMTAEEACLKLAAAAQRVCSERIDRLQQAMRSGAATPAQAADLLKLQEIRARLEASLAGPASLAYQPLLPDSSDSQETLRTKLQYYQDERSYLERLDGRVSARLAQISQERRTLLEAQRFMRDLDFLDEGGRISPGGSARVPRLPPASGASEDPSRPSGQVQLGGQANDLEFALGVSPTTPQQSDHITAVLQEFRREIQRELEKISKDVEVVQERILPGLPGAP